MRKLTLFCILALAVFVTVPAFAEVQNIKVSGDLGVRYLLRNDFDLDKDVEDDLDDYIMSTAELQINADLTDNVSTVVRLVNQRDWNDVYPGVETSHQFDVVVDLAYVELKELVYSPLTLTIGRQDLWYGKGFIIGAKQSDPEDSISANEYTVINSFDAIKASLDLDPWAVDLLYSKIEENKTAQGDDVDLYGVNVGYKFGSYNAEAEAYLFVKEDRSKTAYPVGDVSSPTTTEQNRVRTWGIRGSIEPIQNAYVYGELAFQNGKYSIKKDLSRKREAWAYDIGADYTFDGVLWTPKVGIEYIFYSGEDITDPTEAGNKWNAWDPMYRGKFDTAIREFQNLYYLTQYRADNTTVIVSDQDSGATNQKQLLLKGTVQPTSSLIVNGRFAWFWFDEPVKATNGEDDVGTELDVMLTYDYTEDVSFSVLTAWFFPGSYWPNGQDDRASEVVGSVNVSF